MKELRLRRPLASLHLVPSTNRPLAHEDKEICHLSKLRRSETPLRLKHSHTGVSSQTKRRVVRYAMSGHWSTATPTQHGHRIRQGLRLRSCKVRRPPIEGHRPHGRRPAANRAQTPKPKAFPVIYPHRGRALFRRRGLTRRLRPMSPPIYN